MLRLKQVSRADTPESVMKYYQALSGDRDPVEEPGTAKGTLGLAIAEGAVRKVR